MSHAPEHVCAALPKLCVSAHVVFCQVHQAWTHTLLVYELDGDEPTELTRTAVELGPFDDPDEIARAFVHAIAAAQRRQHA